MRREAINHMITIANDDDYLEFITAIYDPIVIKKSNLGYSFFHFCIRFNDNAKKEKYMIQLESLEAIKIIVPKFKGMNWWSGQENKAKAKAGA